MRGGHAAKHRVLRCNGSDFKVGQARQVNGKSRAVDIGLCGKGRGGGCIVAGNHFQRDTLLFKVNHGRSGTGPQRVGQQGRTQRHRLGCTLPFGGQGASLCQHQYPAACRRLRGKLG
ncbi:hypothetical protein SDC9_153657 [bioreactor metagenome]|uniref:Uncharacterized protein n=1 Tax=bioreactor metagenome TaxID=1076179 RepID=A0A645EWJ1_9ZZZZ